MDITMIMMGNIGYKDTLDFFIERKLVVYNDNDGWGEKGGYRRTPTHHSRHPPPSFTYHTPLKLFTV